MKFEWDVIKDRANFFKHGVCFEEAITAFDDPHALIALDEGHSSRKEIREWLIGEADIGIIVVVYTTRLKGRVWRLISARKANKKERMLYEAYRFIPF